jgi:osmoprotectant transport system substrate-binding protein
MRRPLKLTSLAVAAALALAACGSSSNSSSGTTAAPSSGSQPATTAGGGGGASLDGVSLTVGSANFPENILLAEIYAQALEAKGAKVARKLNIGSREVYYKALTTGEIQLLPEYTNSLLSFVLKAKGQSPTAKNVTEQVDALKAALPSTLTVLTPSTAEDKDVIVCNKQTADKYNLKTLSDLAKVSSNIVLGGPPELAQRSPFGIPGFKQIYGATFKAFKPLEIGPPIADALKSNAIQCGNLFSTMSVITTNGFVALDDDKGTVPNEAVLPLIAKDKATPAVQSVLDAVDGKLDTDQLKGMMVKVEVNAADPAKVATDWLKQNGLVS